MKIGIVDVDTSHPGAWIPIERELGHEVIGVWDGGSIHPREYVQQFAREQQIPRVYDTLEQMAADVDGAIIHSCDWDTHVAKARPFVAAGKAVLIDKPMAGNQADLAQFIHWAEQGVRITGGSSLRFCNEARAFLDQPESQRGRVHTVFCGCAVDDFNYGIHAYALLAALMQGDPVSVQHLGAQGGQRRIRVNWSDGRMGVIVVGAAAQWQPFHAAVVTDRAVHQFIADSTQLYRALLEATLPYLSGATDAPPVAMQQLIAPERWALAAKHSWTHDDREVMFTNGDPGIAFDGARFAVEYRKMKYPA